MEKLTISSDRKLGESFLAFFTSGINFKPEENRHIPNPVEVNDHLVYKAIYIHLPYTKRLFDYLRQMAIENKLSNCQCKEKEIKLIHRPEKEEKETVRQILISQDNIPADFWTICGNEITQIAKEFYAFLSKNIEANENFIRKSDELDKDLVDLLG